MLNQGIQIDKPPQLRNPVLIAAFEGWGNALNVASAMVDYIIRKCNADRFAQLDSDTFYRYDEQRPYVDIEEGVLHSLSTPGGSFYAAHTRSEGPDLVLLQADEPSLRWHQFSADLFSLCRELGIETIITLGSMYDNVLHSDRIISGIASDAGAEARLAELKIVPITYRGPSAVHSILMSDGAKKGLNCISLWSHCPYYLQGTTHFGNMVHLGGILASLSNFEIDTVELNEEWEKLKLQIQGLIEKNTELQNLIAEIRKEKVRGFSENLRGTLNTDDNVINITDFLDPK